MLAEKENSHHEEWFWPNPVTQSVCTLVRTTHVRKKKIRLSLISCGVTLRQKWYGDQWCYDDMNLYKNWILGVGVYYRPKGEKNKTVMHTTPPSFGLGVWDGLSWTGFISSFWKGKPLCSIGTLNQGPDTAAVSALWGALHQRVHFFSSFVGPEVKKTATCSVLTEQIVLIDAYGMKISLWLLLASVCKQGWT